MNAVPSVLPEREWFKSQLTSAPERLDANGRSAMADKDITIGRVINITGMLGVSSGILLFAFGIVVLLFRRGLGFDIASAFHWFW
jgi:hypothetical protein